MKHSVKSFSSLYFAVFFVLVIFSVSATSFAAESSQPVKISPGVLQKVKPALHPISEPLSVLDSRYNRVKQLLSSYQSTYSAFKLKLDQCSDPNKTFTKADQEAAHCVPSDTVDKCSEKLLIYCSATEAVAFFNAFRPFEEELRGLEIDAYNIGCKQQNLFSSFSELFQFILPAMPMPPYCQPVTLQP